MLLRIRAAEFYGGVRQSRGTGSKSAIDGTLEIHRLIGKNGEQLCEQVVANRKRRDLAPIVKRLGRRVRAQRLSLMGASRRSIQKSRVMAQGLTCDQDRHCTVPPRVRHFDGSPCVQRVARAVKNGARVVFLWLVVEHEHDLPGRLYLCIVIVSVLGCCDPVSHKDDLTLDMHVTAEGAGEVHS